jgi:leader peptidase (prepilin peptidase)/N-methyltransferase
MEEAFLIVFGLIWGSFLNVVIHRLPRGESLVRPPSRCPQCQRAIRPWENIPVLSYLFLLGRCPGCRGRISPRYPLVELASASAFFYAGTRHGLTLHGAMTAVFLLLLLALALIDLEHMILPDELTLGGAALFLVYSFFNPDLTPMAAFLTAFGGAAVLTALFFFYLKVRKIEGLGFGDVKMMLLLGAFLGPEKLIVTILTASVLGLLVGLFLIVFRGKNLQMALPFGTFLSAGAIISMLFSTYILSFLTGQFPL